MVYKHGDLVQYKGQTCEVIEQRGNNLIIEILGSNPRDNKKFTSVPAANVTKETRQASDKLLIRTR